MKKMTFVIFMTLLLLSTNSFSQINHKQLKKETPKGLSFKYDKFEQISWIGTDYQPLGSPLGDLDTKLATRMYFGIKKNGSITGLKLEIRYAGDDWVFSDEIIFLCGKPKEVRKDEVTPITVTLNKSNNDVLTGGYVNEHLSVIINDEAMKWIMYYVNGGQYTASKLKGSKGSLLFATFGKKVSKTFKALYEYYTLKSQS